MNNSKRVVAFITLTALTLLMVAGCKKSKEDTTVDVHADNIVIDANKQYQTIDNFAASDAWSMDPIGKEWSEENKEKIADLLFSDTKGIGLSAWRFNIGAGSSVTDQIRISNDWRRAESFQQNEGDSYDWSKQAGQQWFLKSAKDRGVNSFVAFVNSPPVWATKNGNAQHGNGEESTNLKEGYEDKFSKFMADVVKHFRDQGYNINYLSPINEPCWIWDYKSNQEGCRYSVEDAKKVINSLYNQLSAENLKNSVQILAPEAPEYRSLWDDETHKDYVEFGYKTYDQGMNAHPEAGKYREYAKEFLGDKDIRNKIGNTIAAHAYWSEDDLRQTLYRTTTRSEISKYSEDARFWQSEFCLWESGRDYGIEAALKIARVIHNDLTKLNASAWQWWTAVSKENWKDGLIYTDYKNQGDNQNIIETKSLWALGNFSKFVRPGAKRVELKGADDVSGLMGSAYLDEKAKKLVMVYVNYGQDDKPIKMSITNLPMNKKIKNLTPYITSDKLDSKTAQPKVSASGIYIVPGKSIVTLVGEVE